MTSLFSCSCCETKLLKFSSFLKWNGFSFHFDTQKLWPLAWSSRKLWRRIEGKEKEKNERILCTLLTKDRISTQRLNCFSPCYYSSWNWEKGKLLTGWWVMHFHFFKFFEILTIFFSHEWFKLETFDFPFFHFF